MGETGRHQPAEVAMNAPEFGDWIGGDHKVRTLDAMIRERDFGRVGLFSNRLDRPTETQHDRRRQRLEQDVF